MARIGIIACGRNRGVWIEDHGDFADWIPPFLRQADATLTFEVFQAHDGNLPDRVDICDAWLLTGSPMSVYDNRPWQIALTAFALEALKHRPMIGMCYGHQHLHAALGGIVQEGAHWGVGIQHYRLNEMPVWLSREIAQESAHGFRLIALHQDYVLKPAPTARILAGNTDCVAGVTTIGDNVLTFQAHPEMTPALASEIYDFHRDDIGPELSEEAKRTLSGQRDDLLAARWIVAFLERSLSHGTARKLIP